jgi:hypothetical protein
MFTLLLWRLLCLCLSSLPPTLPLIPPHPSYVVQWRGEKDFRYVPPSLREAEFQGSLSTVTPLPSSFKTDLVPGEPLFQTLTFQTLSAALPSDRVGQAAGRCATVRRVFRVLSEGGSLAELVSPIPDPYRHAEERGPAAPTWSVRVRDLRGGRALGKRRGHGRTHEAEALLALAPLTDLLEGAVCLKSPDVALHVLLLPGGRFLLLRLLTSGRGDLRGFDPAARGCVTATPLEPVAAFALANVARASPRAGAALDLYAGSCQALLAAAALGSSRTVGIERANEWLVPFGKIREDFRRRNLNEPTLIRGDCRDAAVRDAAGGPFGAVLADVPYGVRESVRGEGDGGTPVRDILELLAADVIRGKPLIREGGRVRGGRGGRGGGSPARPP